jgi:imidazole glycerol-phosphate synthase subunit HisH
MKIVVIDYKAGNIRSVLFALERIGVNGVLSDDPQTILAADKVIFPGVGEASSAMKALKERELDHLIPSLRQPVLGICLGMQLLCQSSEEGTTDCLGVFPVKVRRFPVRAGQAEKVPHVGWNTVEQLSGPLYSGIADPVFMYYVHSYFAEESSYTTGFSKHVLRYSASLQKDNFHAVQYHPEKSGKAGEQLLRNFLAI